LDNKSAFVFTSEFYYGIAAQRKKDLAARRISKLIDFTKVNDALRAEYKDLASKLKALLEKVNGILQDRAVDNTMAGAKAKLAQYYTYKKDDKGVIVGTFLKLEAVFNQLSLRLEDRKRPAFNPGEGLAVTDFRTALAALDKLEAERGVELIAELNRQLHLVQVAHQHEARYTKIKAWVEQKQKYLSTKERVESSGAAEYQLNRLASYEDEAIAVQTSTVADLNNLGAELVREKYEHSAKTSAHEAEIKADWERLASLATTKNAVLLDDLARCKYKEAIELVALKHKAKYEQLVAWINEKKTYLQKQEVVCSVNEAQLALSALDSYEADKKDLESNSVPALRALGTEIVEAEYKSDHSTWKYEKPDEIKSRESSVDSTLSGELVTLGSAKRVALENDLKREIEKERLRLEFAQQAGALHRWAKSVAEDVDADKTFGDDLAAVEGAKAKLDAQDQKNKTTADDRKTKALEVLAQAQKLGVKENPYTDLTPAELDDAVGKLNDAVKGRQDRYAKELERVRANDALCRQFAALANPLVEAMDKNKNTVNEFKSDDLEGAAKQVDSFLAANLGTDDIKKIEDLQSQIDAANITTNKHSPYTAQDVVVRHSQYNEYLKSKKSQLAEQIKMKALRGMTEEQLSEIERQFKQFDKNGNGRLDKSEFKACLYSLGEERPNAEVQALMREYGDEKNISHDGFKRFMVKLLGDSETKQEITAGFKLLANDEPAVSEKELVDVFPAMEDVNYLKEHVAPKGDRLDYATWTEQVFAR
jgi:Ca2+-binding EF-hand superfamily protein